MRVIVHPRRGGKTIELIKLSAILNIPIMTFRQRIPFIEKFGRDELGLLFPKPIPYPKFVGHLYDGNPRMRCPEAVLLDDAGEYLKSILQPHGFDPLAAAFNQDGDPMCPVEYSRRVDVDEW